MDWRGVVPLTANCSGQANEKEDMSECRGCINIALKDGRAGGQHILLRLQVGFIHVGNVG